MARISIELSVSNSARRIDYLSLEDKTLRPADYFKFINGKWVATFDNFPIGADGDLDVIIIVVGNPGTQCSLDVKIDTKPTLTFALFKPFNASGYGQFTHEIKTTAILPAAPAAGLLTLDNDQAQ